MPFTPKAVRGRALTHKRAHWTVIDGLACADVFAHKGEHRGEIMQLPISITTTCHGSG